MHEWGIGHEAFPKLVDELLFHVGVGKSAQVFQSKNKCFELKKKLFQNEDSKAFIWLHFDSKKLKNNYSVR